MTDKQIIIDYENLCENYSKEVGCYNTFDGNCIKEQCFTYRLLQLLQAKEQECEKLKKDLHQNFEEKDKLHLIIDRLLEASGCDINTASAEDFEDVYENMRYEKQQLEQLGQTLTEIKEIAENSCCLQPTSDCEEYKKCNECSRTSDDVTVKQILQKISECEVENAR